MKISSQTSRVVAGIMIALGYGIALWTWWSRRPSSETLWISPASVQLLYDEQGRSLHQRGESHQCDAVINAGYFGYDEQGLFIPAGLWQWGDDIRPHSDPSDPNLRWTVSIQDSNKGSIDRYDGEVSATQGVDRFSAGPIMVEQGQRQSLIDQDVSHWQGSHPRTVMLVDQQGVVSLVVFRGGITLSYVADILIDHGVYDAINLDGGPSTAYRSVSSDDASFRPETVLPLVWCIEE